MRALVTGGAGFIGSHLARHLLDLGAEVMVLDNLSGGFRDNVPEGARFVRDNVCYPEVVKRIFDNWQPTHVYHLAAYAAEGLSHWIRRQNYEINLIGSANLINEAVRCGVERFVFTSSMSVYGSQLPPFDEGMPRQPEDPYAVAKAAVEQDLEAAHALWGLPYTIVRPHNVYGPGQNLGDPYRNVVGIFMRQALQGESLTVFGDGSQVRSFSYVGDIVPALADCGWEPKAARRIVNLGSEQPVTVLELAEKVRQVLGEPTSPILLLPRRYEVAEAYSSHNVARDLFGHQPNTPLNEGLALMAAWAREAGVRWSRWEPEAELTKGMPPSWLSRQKALIASSGN